MTTHLPPFLQYFIASAQTGKPRPGLNPIPGTTPVTALALISPIVVFYAALLLLAPFTTHSPLVQTARTLLAVLALVLFARLPLAHHVPMSIGLTYQLSLVGIWGACRVVDLFFIGPLLFGHVPRRVFYRHTVRAEGSDITQKPVVEVEQPPAASATTTTTTTTGQDDAQAHKQARRPSLTRGVSQSDLVENMTSESYTALLQTLLVGPNQLPVRETQHLDTPSPATPAARAAWALELALSMRGVGFSWTTADVRHAHDTWLPTPASRAHALAFCIGPVLLASWALIRRIYATHLVIPAGAPPAYAADAFDALPLPEQLALTAALGAFLMAAFAVAHHAAALLATPLAPHPLAYFPPLYPAPVWGVRSVRGFWSRAWHRLFARLFLVFGVWPGEAIERRVRGAGPSARADVGKVLGAFASSAAVHAFAVRGVLGGRWADAGGEALFFSLNGVAVLVEGLVVRNVKRWRRERGGPEGRWYDGVVGRVWWVAVLLGTGRYFARGWTRAGLVREMAFM